MVFGKGPNLCLPASLQKISWGCCGRCKNHFGLLALECIPIILTVLVSLQLCNLSPHHLVVPLQYHHFPRPPHIRFHCQEKILEIQHCLTLFSLTYSGFSEISLPHWKQEVSAGSGTNGIVLCGMSPIVMGTKTSWNKDKGFKSARVPDPSIALHCVWGMIEWIGSLQEYT